MTGVRVGWRGLVGLAVLGVGSLSAPGAAEVATLPVSCPGYVVHLRSARAHLDRGDRRAAVDALRQARKALDSCARSDATSDAVATSGASPVEPS